MSSPTSTVVLVPTASPDALPTAAWPALRVADVVYAAPDVAQRTRDALDVKPAPPPQQLASVAASSSVVLVAGTRSGPAADVLVQVGASVIGTDAPAMARAIAVMDRLRSPGGCPWDAEQTHESLRQYLVEETYELLDAIEHDDREGLREELGDVLLQVLFHARVAAEHPRDPFDIDEVAERLVTKLVARHPHVFAEQESVRTAEHQQRRWEELKRAEKRRASIIDGVPLGQPAVALAGKLGHRTGRAGVPFDLLPPGSDRAANLFRLAAAARRGGADPEGELRAVAKEFAESVRAAERAAQAEGVDPTMLEADGWRQYWPH